MLRTDKLIYKLILILNLLLIVAGLVLCVLGIASPETNFWRILSRIFTIAALLFGGFYLLEGYSKNAAKFFKIYGLLFVCAEVVSVVSSVINMETPLTTLVIFAKIVSMLLVLFLFMAKDLGRGKSFLLAGLIVIFEVIALLGTVLGTGSPAITVMSVIVHVDLACLYGIMVFAKYLDKSERNTR